MADVQTQSNDVQPHLAVAVICEKAEADADQAPSIIRIIDNAGVDPDKHVRHGEVVALSLQLFVMFRSGEARGPRKVDLVMVNPSGDRNTIGEMEADFPGGPEETGFVVRATELRFPWDKEGLHWFEIWLGGELRTRVPLRLHMVRPEGAGAAPGS